MLNTHSSFSLRYGVVAPEIVIEVAMEKEYTHIALTDINATTGCHAFVRAAQAKKMNPIVGVDVRNGLKQCYVILAKNNRGFHELNTFLSHYLQQHLAFPEQPPFMSNVVVIYPWKIAPLKLASNEWLGVNAAEINQLKVRKTGFEHQKRMVILQSMTFRNKRDFNTHRLLRAIDTNVLLSKLAQENQALASDLFYSRSELRKLFEDFPEIIDRTEVLLQSCTIHFMYGEDAPQQNVISYTGNIEEDFERLQKLAYEGISYRYANFDSAIATRIEKELAVIKEKGYLSYFLISWEIVSYAQSKGYFYVGRGSGANSLVAYLLRITDVDPLELDLYFERFINLYRKNPPDFDLDFSWKNRDDVTRYIFERFPNAALLCTYNTFQYKAAVRELGKVFGLPKADIDTLCAGKFEVVNLDELAKLVIQYAKQIEGLPSYLSIHAGGIVISEKPMSWLGATFLPPKGYPTTQFSMLEAEDVGLYKFDILSQRGLSKIHDCLTNIALNQPDAEVKDIHDLAFFKNDERIKELLRKGNALGCFYVESPAMRMLMSKLKTDSYLGLVAASSIIRPGVSQSGMMREYILRHRSPERRKEAHPILLEIMPETYGVMVYQEDVIKVAHYFAGLDLGEADVLRRGMSGKFRSREEFQAVKDKFFSNCLTKGFEEKVIAEIWRQIESFAGYAFAKGHSASYAVESYQSLYLKAYFPLEYMVATINNFGGFYATEIYVHEARMLGGEIEPPSMNFGEWETTIFGKLIYLGFNLLAGIESKIIGSLLLERENGKFLGLDNLLDRIFVPLDQLCLLIRIGAFRDFQEPKTAMLWRAHFYHNKSKAPQVSNTLFSGEVAKVKTNFNLPNFHHEVLEDAFEQLELLNFTLCSPFDLLASKLPLHALVTDLMNSLGLRIMCYVYLVTAKRTKTSTNEYMYFGTFLDQKGETLDTVHFPEVARRFPFQGKGIYQITGVVVEEFGYYTVEVGEMRKLPYCEDMRYTESSSVHEHKKL